MIDKKKRIRVFNSLLLKWIIVSLKKTKQLSKDVLDLKDEDLKDENLNGKVKLHIDCICFLKKNNDIQIIKMKDAVRSLQKTKQLPKDIILDLNDVFELRGDSLCFVTYNKNRGLK